MSETQSDNPNNLSTQELLLSEEYPTVEKLQAALWPEDDENFFDFDDCMDDDGYISMYPAQTSKLYLSVASYIDLIRMLARVVEVDDVTDILFNWLKNAKHNPQFFFHSGIIADYGGGKTSLGFIIGWTLLLHDTYIKHSDLDGKDYPRSFCLFNVPHFLLLDVKTACATYCKDNNLPDYSERFYVADEMDKIRPNSYVLVDEGISTFFKDNDNSEFTENFIRSIQRDRHFRISFWINAGSNDLSTKYRKIQNYKNYKPYSKTGMRFNKAFDEIESNYGHIIQDLKVTETLIDIHIKEVKIFGKATINLYSHEFGCPWYNEEISTNASKEEYDVNKSEKLKRIALMDHYINLYMQTQDWDIKTPVEALLGWLSVNHNHDYSKLAKYQKEISHRFGYFKRNEQAAQATQQPYPEFVQTKYDTITEKNVIGLHLSGMAQATIRKEVGGQMKKITDTIKHYNTMKNVLQTQYQQRYNLRGGWDRKHNRWVEP